MSFSTLCFRLQVFYIEVKRPLTEFKCILMENLYLFFYSVTGKKTFKSRENIAGDN